LALRGEPLPFALSGRWAGGGAIVGCAPRFVLAPGADPFACLEDVPGRTRDAGRGDGGAACGEGGAVACGEGGAVACDFVGGGWFGWLGYGLGARVEALPPRPPRPHPLPDAHLAFYDHVLRLDAGGRWWFEALEEDFTPASPVAPPPATASPLAAAPSPAAAAAPPPSAAARRAALEARLARLRALLAAAPEPVAPAPAAFALRPPGAAGHVAAVAECVERIAAGEIFQANLCLRLDARYDGDVADLFAHALPRLQPAYAACFVTPWGGIASLSPELFLRRRGRVVTTGPIKGTAPREQDPARLSESAKDRAEHVMIVDLMRNDLGRVAEYGSVQAPDSPDAQAHAGVWHLVSDVHARLAPGQGDAALLRATFPPGSVTGAPKIQALKVISELEATGREVYTGAIGYASPHAGLELNVAIRTFEAHSGRLWLGAGGGIVADSHPQLELEECLVKARPLLAAINATLTEGSDPAYTRPPRLQGFLRRPGGEGSDPPYTGAWRPDPERGVFETLQIAAGVAVNLDAHLARLARSVRALYGEELPARIELPRRDGAVRITYVPGRPLAVDWRPLTPRALPIALTPYVLPGGLGEHKWVDRRWLDARSQDGTTPLLLDADGALLEAAWAAVLIRRDGALLTPRPDGRILPSTSLPATAEHRDDLHLQPGDELLLSSSLAGIVPATARLRAGSDPR